MASRRVSFHGELEEEEVDEEPAGRQTSEKRVSRMRTGTKFVRATIEGQGGEERSAETKHSSDDDDDEDGLELGGTSEAMLEQAARLARMSKASKKGQMRELRRNDLDYAVVQLVQLAQKNTKVLPVDLPAKEKSSGSLLAKLGGCCLCVCQSLPCAPRSGGGSSSRRKDNRKGAYESGYLWKLNSEVAEDSKHLSVLKSWRRRLFFVLEPRCQLGDVAVVYISEKQDGQVHLVALLGLQGKSRSAVEELEPVKLNQLGGETKFWALSVMKQYDVAFLAPGGLAADEDYDPKVPEELFPFAITWQDAAGAEQRCVLAAPTADERQKWTQSIRVILAKMGSEATEAT